MRINENETSVPLKFILSPCTETYSARVAHFNAWLFIINYTEQNTEYESKNLMRSFLGDYHQCCW